MNYFKTIGIRTNLVIAGTIVSLLLAAPSACAVGQFLHVKGGRVVDGAGKPVILRGINLGNWLVPEGYMFLFEDGPESAREIDALFREIAGPDATDRFWRAWREHYITEPDIAHIASLGLNTVRLPLHHKLLDEGGEAWPHVDHAIEWARKHRLYVILDLHAAPSGQTGTNIDDSWGYPWLFESERAQAETVELWRRIATRYKDEPAVAGYDLLNEPIPHFHDLPKLNPRLEPLYRRIVSAIREVDRNHIVILEGAQWASRFDMFGPPFDANAMYSFHKYWTTPTRDVIDEYLAYGRKFSVPLYLGESGENSDEWIAKFVHVLEQEGVHWTFWPYKKMGKTSCLVSFGKPSGWDEIVAYAKTGGSVAKTEKKIASRPTPEVARQALNDLIARIEFARCKPNHGYEAALGVH